MGGPSGAVLPFTAEADAALLAFERELEPRLRPHGDLGHITDWASKLAGATARIAGLLHLAGNVRTGWAKPVSVDDVEAAKILADYFVSHALAVFDLMEADDALADAQAVAQWATERDEFTKREAHRAFQHRFVKANDLDPVLDLLADRGWIRLEAEPQTGPRGGRPTSPRYVVNPLTQLTQPTQPPTPKGSVSCVSSVTNSDARHSPARTCASCGQPTSQADDNGFCPSCRAGHYADEEQPDWDYWPDEEQVTQ